MKLTFLCVTKAEAHAIRFLELMSSAAYELEAALVIVADGEGAYNKINVQMKAWKILDNARLERVESKGFIESVLDEALSFCSDGFVLRLDDDEGCSNAMIQWLREKRHEGADHWKFARANLWPVYMSVAITPHLWQDHQTRLSVKEKSGGRNTIHVGSPFGGGELAPVVIEHHKFLVKSLEERREIVKRYDGISENMGTAFSPFSVPEDAYPNGFHVVPLYEGWTEKIEKKAQQLRR